MPARMLSCSLAPFPSPLAMDYVLGLSKQMFKFDQNVFMLIFYIGLAYSFMCNSEMTNHNSSQQI